MVNLQKFMTRSMGECDRQRFVLVHVDYNVAATMLRTTTTIKKAYKSRGHKQSKHIQENFSLENEK